jgi:hypothetical protein
MNMKRGLVFSLCAAMVAATAGQALAVVNVQLNLRYTRNIYSLAQAGAMGVEYISLGRNPVGVRAGDDRGNDNGASRP